MQIRTDYLHSVEKNSLLNINLPSPIYLTLKITICLLQTQSNMKSEPQMRFQYLLNLIHKFKAESQITEMLQKDIIRPSNSLWTPVTIPNIDEIFGKVGACQYFSTLDLAKGFHQIEIQLRILTYAFWFERSSATFQRLINNVFGDYKNKICLVYLDAIIVFSSPLEEHLESIKEIFKRSKRRILSCNWMSQNF